jgi:glucosamine-6-phosphate deaminase
MVGQAITYEKIPTQIYADSKDASRAVAQEIADLIRSKQKEGKNCVLGLATGSSPKTVYAQLIKMHREEGLSFKNVVSFNLDEYYPMQPDSIHSYVRFMREQLFDHVDIPKENYFIPDGTVPPAMIADFAQRYDNKINAMGGIDFQLLGIGGNGPHWIQ